MPKTTLDPTTFASNPGSLNISNIKLQRNYPELFSTFTWIKFIFSIPEFPFTTRAFWKNHIAEHLQLGDSRAAVVLRTKPLLIAAYSDDIDCSLVLEFPEKFVAQYRLEPGKRLLTVNTYSSLEETNGEYESDVIPGERSSHMWGNFFPYIADFLSDEHYKISSRKTEIDEEEWERAQLKGEQFLQNNSLSPRFGHPLICGRPSMHFKK